MSSMLTTPTSYQWYHGSVPVAPECLYFKSFLRYGNVCTYLVHVYCNMQYLKTKNDANYLVPLATNW